MTSWKTRFLRAIMACVLLVMVTLAVAITALRITLPKLNQYQSEIEQWVNSTTGMTFQIEDVSGYWRNTHPFVALHGLDAQFPGQDPIKISLQTVEVEFDLFQSIFNLSPTVSTLYINGLELDISDVGWRKNADNKPTVAEPTKAQPLQDVRQLLLYQLADFSLKQSKVTYQTFNGEVKAIDIERLKWRNSGHHHQGEGVISASDDPTNRLAVQGSFFTNKEFDLTKLTGDFFASADNLQIKQWLPADVQKQTGITNAQLSFRSWVTLKQGKAEDAFIEVLPSELGWQNEDKHLLTLERGSVLLELADQGWQINAHNFQLRTDDTPWPTLDWVFNWQPEQWTLNVSQLDISTIVPITRVVPQIDGLARWLQEVEIGGQVEDIRASATRDFSDLKYSAQLSQGEMQQWYLLPEVHKLSAQISGDAGQLRVQADLVDDVLPYGEVFQAPLNIKQGHTDLVFEFEESSWSIWSPKVTAATPDLQVIGAFKLDFPKERSPFLSFYAEADLFNAAETWRYLPTLALGQGLTDYLSTAIQGGQVDTAKLLWFGELGNFPYDQHNGIFQADVPLKNSRFSFDTSWPTITELQLDLLFENAAMYLDSRSAQLVDVKAKRITGRIPFLGPDGHIEIEAKAAAEGTAVRDYMMATPLIDSVGAALTAVEVHGNVESEFQLFIPFSGKDSRAWGWADLNNNQVHVQTPPIKLEQASGRIEFDDDVVSASKLSAHLLDQPVDLSFKGETQDGNYAVNIDTSGDWQVKPLSPYVGESWLTRLDGHAPWNMGIDLQLTDVGFSYQIDVNADIAQVESHYPSPLKKALGAKGKASLQASGNQEMVSARLQLPDVKYQAEIDLQTEMPELVATNLIVGKGAFRLPPIVGHSATIRHRAFNLDDWIALFVTPKGSDSSTTQELDVPALPLPTRIDLSTPQLTIAGLEWHDVEFQARKKNLGWRLSLNSAEAKGEATYLAPYDLSVVFDRLQIYVPALEDEQVSLNPIEAAVNEVDETVAEKISDLDKSLHQALPNLTLAIHDFWFQGYKVGKVNVDFQRSDDKLEWRQVSLRSGSNKFDGSGWWRLDGDTSESHFEFQMSGDNNSDLMERFGISSGVQQAPFDMSSSMNWQGSPWNPQVDTLNGSMKSELGPGVISDVSGAARLLGLFSLDSIIRKMQLDFTGVFDKGMAFNKISGTATVSGGVVVTNDIEMDAVAGNMLIRGLADLNTRQVDAEVEFTPDLTSGIPILSAFAVAPQTAIYVFAVTTVLSPVIDVITQVRYQVKGPLENPQVTELSRSKGKYQVPEQEQK
ncbi:YhdP family protein [Vibrio sp. SCSIO 43136]|uniref:YhdP family protein n=1 Tax=Vibrio sp. SCSIO 43136 TaxID=2819101 RepID=UPI0020760A16|nr:YhdP family protein [Vibrio sp. SCSIO 43136]USD65006.1 TIGR02099 family protein [Vibrio sp. SCSIO 43136]